MSAEQMPNTHPTWSPDQLAAITHRGQDILVAAAAGSGKTAVLVERIIRLITDEQQPVDIDQLLVATFTNAAAAEMKQRIREAIEKELMNQPQSNHLRKQLAMMGRASIMTIHSFCKEVVTRYVNMTPLDPRFRIANETEIELLKQEMLEEVLEEYYSEADERSYFWRLVDTFSSDRSDQALMELVHKLHQIAQSQPWPEAWLREMVQLFESSEDHGEAYPFWKNSLLHDCDIELEGVIETLTYALDLASDVHGPSLYINILMEDIVIVRQLREATLRDWSVLHLAFQHITFKRLPNAKSDEFDPLLKLQVQQLRKQAKDQIHALQEDLFGRTPEQFVSECRQIAPLMQMLVEVILKFDARFQAAKVKKSLVDFNDLEHYALNILSEPNSNSDQLMPSAAALTYRSQFAEILLDEYQDTNLVQETIMALIAHQSPGNRFMVGDVKQSIYRFRLAEPTLFQEKYRNFLSYPTDLTQGKRIDLARNFRSRQQVVDAVNFVFKQIMSETVGEIDYDEQAQLRYGASYPDASDEMDVEVVLIDRHKVKSETDNTDDEQMSDEYLDTEDTSDASDPFESPSEDSELDQAEIETAQCEATAIAMRIQALVRGTQTQAPFRIWDKQLQAERAVTYRDIVILMRASKQWAPIFTEQLQKYGIPAYADLSTGYFTATEVEVMMSLLKIIDNPIQDIPLAAVLRSPLVGLTADELTRIRLVNKKIAFYQNLEQFLDSSSEEATDPPLQSKIAHFLQQVERWRDQARQGELSDLIWAIYHETAYYDYVGGLPGGLQRQANLRALYDRARQYEATSLRGLFRFLRFIDRMQESGADLGAARAIGEQEDVVRLMTIHKSKGLEFPIVFVAGLAKQFNQRDLKHFFLVHKKLGFGPRFVDTDLRVSYPTLSLLTIKKRMKLELLAEELRVLYVAMTRAREKLILIGTVPSAERLFQRWSQHLARREIPLSNDLIARARSYLDWLGPALIRHPAAQVWREHLVSAEASATPWDDEPSAWQFTVVPVEQLNQPLIATEQAMIDAVDRQAVFHFQPVAVQTTWMPWFDEQFNWTYAHQDALRFFAKTTVTEMKRLQEKERWQAELAQMNADVVAESDTDSLSAEQPSDQQLGEAALETQQASAYRRPRFLEQQAGLTPAERGTVMHAVMQNITLHEQPTAQSIAHMLKRMIEKQQLTEAQVKVVNIPYILTFFQTPLGQRLLKAQWIQREVPFSYGIPAADVYGEQAKQLQETVLIQGVIDCLFEDEQGLVLLDYKTDATKSRHLDALKERYALQISLYRQAIEHILKRPIAQAYVYYFDGAHLVEM